MATVHSQIRRVYGVTSRDVMNREPTTASPDDDLFAIWELMQHDQSQGVVVMDHDRKLRGIITINDFLKKSAEDCKRGFPQCLFDYFHKIRSGQTKPRLARDLMTTPVISVTETTDVVRLLPLFARHHFNHLPVINEDKKLVGIITLPHLMSVFHDDVAAKKA